MNLKPQVVAHDVSVRELTSPAAPLTPPGTAASHSTLDDGEGRGGTGWPA